MIVDVRKKLDDWWAKREQHDVPGAGEADILSLANILADVLTELERIEAEQPREEA